MKHHAERLSRIKALLRQADEAHRVMIANADQIKRLRDEMLRETRVLSGKSRKRPREKTSGPKRR
jgi:hypothetical protein